jgi:thioredoxin 1
MSINNVSRLGIVAAIVVVVIMFGISKMRNNSPIVEQKDVTMVVEEKTEQPALENNQKMMENQAMEGKSETMKDSAAKIDSTVKAGSYEAYASEKIARAETGDVVLFFHASWCPSCRGLNGDIEKNMSSIPDGVSILKVDYDKETELKKKYGVTYQHTLVQVDKDGNLIKKWSGSPTLTRLVSEIK